MRLLCRLLGHRWSLHGLPVDRRICLTCLLKQDLVDKEWRNR